MSGNNSDDRMNVKEKIRLIAFYLPQYHPIPENDEWWGKGFTEWTNTAKARPLFRGHYQPHIPADLGFYDLRVPETRIAQAEMAREYGIHAFCYYHYWFAGKQLLERPFNEVVATGQPDFPFCLCWANQTWTGIWHGAPNRVLIEQTYPGKQDYERHFNYVIRAFTDKRYLTVDEKPLFVVYSPNELPDPLAFTDYWRELAYKSGLKGIYLVGYSLNTSWSPSKYGFDASVVVNLPPKRRPWVSKRTPIKWLQNKLQMFRNIPTVLSYAEHLPDIVRIGDHEVRYQTVIPNWDNTPRSAENGLVLHGSTPELFRLKLQQAIYHTLNYVTDDKLLFIKSWNEWAEGNHLEPDMRFGFSYLEVLKKELDKVRMNDVLSESDVIR